MWLDESHEITVHFQNFGPNDVYAPLGLGLNIMLCYVSCKTEWWGQRFDTGKFSKLLFLFNEVTYHCFQIHVITINDFFIQILNPDIISHIRGQMFLSLDQKLVLLFNKLWNIISELPDVMVKTIKYPLKGTSVHEMFPKQTDK